MIKSNGLHFLLPLFDWQHREKEVNVVDEKIQSFHILENLEHPSRLKISFLGSSPFNSFEFMSTFISHSFKTQLINRIIYISGLKNNPI